MKHIHVATKIILAVVTILVITTSLSIYSINYTNNRGQVMVDLYRLRSDILQANLALKTAALMPKGHHRETELGKMQTTRSSANGVYDRLSAANMTHFEKTVLEEMKKERPEYRSAQMEVVAKIQKGEDIGEMIKPLLYYHTLMDRYIGRVDSLLESTYGSLERTISNSIVAAIGLFVISIFAMLWFLYRSFK